MIHEETRVNWDQSVWNRMYIPKHKFILWLSIQQRLQTKAKLHCIRVSLNDRCCICTQQEERYEHLFFKCAYNQQLMRFMVSWLGLQFRRSLAQWISWSQRAYKGSKTRKQVLCVVLAAVTYQIWRVRNDAYWNLQVKCVNRSIYRRY